MKSTGSTIYQKVFLLINFSSTIVSIVFVRCAKYHVHKKGPMEGSSSIDLKFKYVIEGAENKRKPCCSILPFVESSPRFFKKRHTNLVSNERYFYYLSKGIQKVIKPRVSYNFDTHFTAQIGNVGLFPISLKSERNPEEFSLVSQIIPAV